jgi:hypothetical protein
MRKARTLLASHVHLFDAFGIALNGHHHYTPPGSGGVRSGAGKYRIARAEDPLE